MEQKFLISVDVSPVNLIVIIGLTLVLIGLVLERFSWREKSFFFLLPGFSEDGKIRIPVFVIWYVPLFTKEEWDNLTSDKIVHICKQYWMTYHPHLLDLLMRTGQYLSLLHDGKFIIWEGSYMGINIEIYFSVEILKYGLTIKIWC